MILSFYTCLHNKKLQSYVWFLRYGVRSTEMFVILGHYLPFYPLKSWKTKILKTRKTPEDKTLLHTINDMIWCMVSEIWSVWTELFVVLGRFLPNFEKIKKTPRYTTILHMCIKNYNHMMNGSWGMVGERQTDTWTDK